MQREKNKKQTVICTVNIKRRNEFSDFTNMSRVFQKRKTLLTELAVILHSREIIAGVEDKVVVASESAFL